MDEVTGGAETVRIVDLAAPEEQHGVARTWCVRAVEGGRPLCTFPRKQDAVTAARTELESLPTGGVLQVHLMNGRQQQRRWVQGARRSSPNSASSRSGEATFADGLIPVETRREFAQIRRENERIDQGFELLLQFVVPLVALFLGPGVVLVTADVAAQDSLWGVFFATLALSSACAAFAWFLAVTRSGLGSVQTMALLATCLLVAAWMVEGLGIGGGYVPGSTPTSGTPPMMLVGFIRAATRTWGALGAYLGALSGVVAGLWAARLQATMT